MHVNIINTKVFKKELKQLAKKYASIKEDFSMLLKEIEKDPMPQRYSIGGNLYKIRMAISATGKGKSGGARVITLVKVQIKDDTIIVYLARIYDKSTKGDLTPKEYHNLKRGIGLE